MTRRTRWLLVFLFLMAIGLLALPRLGRLAPDRVLASLPGPLQKLILEPLPTALPAPVATAPLPATWEPIVQATLPPPATPTALPTPTLAPGMTQTPPTSTPLPSPSATSVPPTPTPTVPTETHLDGLRIVPQTFNNCGPANLSIVLGYFGVLIDQEETGEALRGNEVDRNVSPEEMAAFVRDETRLEATVLANGDLYLLKRFLAAGLPVIIEKGYVPEGEEWMGHYLTLVGYRERDGAFIGLDTFLGPWDGSGRAEPYEEVLSYWRHFNYTFVVVYRPEQESLIAALAGPERGDVLRLWEGAAQRAQREVIADPEDAFAWFNLGSSLTRLGDLSGEGRFYRDAAVAFDQARVIGLPYRMLWYQFEPYRAYLAVERYDEVLALADATIATRGGQSVEETYYYQALALEALGDIEGARSSLYRAIGLNAGYEEAQIALANLSGR